MQNSKLKYKNLTGEIKASLFELWIRGLVYNIYFLRDEYYKFQSSIELFCNHDFGSCEKFMNKQVEMRASKISQFLLYADYFTTFSCSYFDIYSHSFSKESSSN